MKTLFTTIIFTLFFAVFFYAPQAFAWAGYEESTNVQIDIPPGNLVRVGREISIFDFSDNKYHPMEVIFMEDIFTGTRLEVQDVESDKKRIFYMERQ